MAFSLYDATVANYLQILGAVGGFLDKSLTHFRDKGIDPAEIVAARLAPDMAPLRFQIVSVAHHSRGAIEAAKTGVFSPSMASRTSTMRRCRGWSARRARSCRP